MRKPVQGWRATRDVVVAHPSRTDAFVRVVRAACGPATRRPAMVAARQARARALGHGSGACIARFSANDAARRIQEDMPAEGAIRMLLR